MGINKIILGTVQFGLKYGINNSDDKPNVEEVQKILHCAAINGIEILDTADAYGDATTLIGNFQSTAHKKFRIVTKFKGLQNNADMEDWIGETLIKLNSSALMSCMFHSVEDYQINGELVQSLHSLRQKGLIENIGVSIYTNAQFEIVLSDPLVHLIQLPFNLLDNQNLRGKLIRDAKEKGKIIHVRSVFLQGLFFMDLNNLPVKLKPLSRYLTILQTLALDLGISMQALALSYVCQKSNIDGIIIGIDNLVQLQSNLDAVSYSLPQSAVEEVEKIIVSNPELLNPVNWK